LLVADYAWLGLMLLDTILRYDQHLKHVENPWGFCEWMVSPFRRRLVEQEDQF
jgi:hypothetical protein